MNLLNTISHMDIFDLCDCLEDDSIDMILADLPYAITALKWDTIIPFEPMWEQFKRIIKPRGAIVLTASGKFTYKLVMSNFEWFKYEWIWDKIISSSGMLRAKYKPMQQHEIILVFGENGVNYYPIMKKRNAPIRGYATKKTKKSAIPIAGIKYDTHKIYTHKYPASIIAHKKIKMAQHPTQKPVALFEYLIRTYTQPGETVFDPTCGSGTTAIAARNTGRNYIVGDNSHEYVEIARKRLSEPYTLPMFEEAVIEDKPEQAVMFEDG